MVDTRECVRGCLRGLTNRQPNSSLWWSCPICSATQRDQSERDDDLGGCAACNGGARQIPIKLSFRSTALVTITLLMIRH